MPCPFADHSPASLYQRRVQMYIPPICSLASLPTHTASWLISPKIHIAIIVFVFIDVFVPLLCLMFVNTNIFFSASSCFLLTVTHPPPSPLPNARDTPLGVPAEALSPTPRCLFPFTSYLRPLNQLPFPPPLLPTPFLAPAPRSRLRRRRRRRLSD